MFLFQLIFCKCKAYKISGKNMWQKQAVDVDRSHEIGENKGIFIG